MKNRLTIAIILLFSMNLLFARQEGFKKVAIERDDIKLSGMIFPVSGSGPFPTVLLLHGFPGGESDILGIGAKLQEAGMITLTFNYGGTFGSKGKYSMANTQMEIEAAFDFLLQKDNAARYNIDTSQIYVGGYSYGGGMALTYAANHHNIKSVFSIAGTDHGEFFREYFGNEGFAMMIDEMFHGLEAPHGPVRFVEGTLPKELTRDDIAKLDSTIDLRKCAALIRNRNVLLIAGLDDPMVTMEDHMLPLYRELQDEGAEDVRFVVLQDDHSFKRSREKISQVIINWIKD